MGDASYLSHDNASFTVSYEQPVGSWDRLHGNSAVSFLCDDEISFRQRKCKKTERDEARFGI